MKSTKASLFQIITSKFGNEGSQDERKEICELLIEQFRMVESPDTVEQVRI